MKKKFELLFVSDSNYKSLVAEILFDNQRLCQINKENGEDNLEIEFLTDLFILEDEVRMNFPLKEFENVLHIAVKELKKS